MAQESLQASSAGLSPGAKLDKFEIVEQIGAGGASIVWKAYDRLLDRFVAIKHLLPERGGQVDEELREQFRREAQTQKRVASRHKHLVHIIDVLDEPRGLFIVMEYVDGPSLEQLLTMDRGPMDQRQALGIIAAAALALDAIHKQNTLHRDLKPANILLPKTGGLKICDFGLAAALMQQDAMDVGTVRYMAPELFGEQQADVRADIYSLGLVAYEMLAGRDKFEDAFKMVLRDTRNQALRWMKWHTNPRAVAPPLHEINEDIPTDLSQIIARAMEKDRDARISTAEEFVAAIRRHFTGEAKAMEAQLEAAKKQQVQANVKTAAVAKKSKLPLILTVNLFIIALVAVGFMWWKQNEANAVLVKQYQEGIKSYNAAEKTLEQAEDARKEAIALAIDLKHLEADEKRVAAAQNYHDALMQFNDVAQRWSTDVNLGTYSLAKATYAAALLEVMADNSRQAVPALLAAGEQVESISKAGLKPDPAGHLNHDHLMELRKQVENEATLASNLRDIARVIEQKEFMRAEERIDDLRLKHASRLKPVHEKQLDRYKRRLNSLRGQQNLADAMQRAIDAYEKGGGDRDARDASRRVILEAQDDGIRDTRFDEMLREYDRMDRFEDAMTLADRSMRSDDFDGAIQHLRQAHSLAKNSEEAKKKEIEAKITELSAERAYRKGKQLLQAGRTQEAISEFQTAEKLGNKAATQELKQLKAASTFASLLANARQAYRRRQYSLVLKLLEGAKRTDEVRTLIHESRFGLAMDEGWKLLKQERLNEARAQFEQARKLNPNSAAVAGAIAEIDSWLQYYKYLQEGDELRRQRQFGKAIELFRKAKELHDKKEVQSRIEEAHYGSWMEKARDFMSKSDWKSAKAALEAAMNIKQTDEAKRLLEQVEPNIPKAKPDA